MRAEKAPVTAQTETHKEPRFAIAMPTLVGKDTWYLPFLPVSAYRKIAENAGIGLDFWPVRPIPEIQAWTWTLTQKDLAAISSASSSFRSEKTWAETLRHPNKTLAIKARLVLPHRDNLKAVEAVTCQAVEQGKYLNIVVYPQTPPEKYNYLIANKLVQPTPEDFRRFGIKTPEDADRFLTNRNLHGWCFDILHSRFLFTNPEFKHLFEHVISRTRLVHLSLGRNDANHQDYPIAGLAELVTVYFSGLAYKDHQKSEIVTLLKAIKGLGFSGPYVFEVPTEAIKSNFMQYGIHGPLTPRNLSLFYQNLRESCEELLAH